MLHSRRFAALVVGLAFACCSCAGDGGSRGSGITTAQGNVASVQTAWREPARATTWLARVARWLRVETSASADTLLENIVVTVEGTTVSGTTDASGLFSIQGRFDGDVSLLFERAEDGLSARIAVDVPAGGTMTLDDVRLDDRSGQATAASVHVLFDGVIVQTDCAAGTVVLASTERAPGSDDTYTLRLDGSSVEDAEGHTLGCGDLRLGMRVRVSGVVEDDGTFGHATVREIT